jgi:predicted RNase H-related nuclease YkuK (DUF458 family)|tara:strand:+ start:15059 stop:15553 length:495 start_codon:yes stop_codon:yes gene_type:complete
MFNQEEIEEIKEFLVNVEEDTKIYLGCDSVKYKKGGTWYARYTTVIIVHLGGRHGSRVFGYTESERDYDPNKTKPRMRLMNESYKVVGLYMELAEELEDFECEIHLDINSNPEHNSNLVIKEAVGYVMGMTGIDAKSKPEAFAASHCADWMVKHKGHQNVTWKH